jgi:hypothetical protein
VLVGSNRRRRQLRWVAGAGFAALAASGALVLVGGQQAHAAVSPGTGNAYAQSLQVTPHEGSLAVGAVFGEALAGHTADFARAQSQGVDLGAIGTSLKGYNCGAAPSSTQESLVPNPLQTESGNPGAAQGESQGPSQSDYGANEFVKATTVPYGEADTTYAGPLAGPTNSFSVSGMASKSWSGLVDGVREAGATSDIGSISLVGGLVQLKGLHWEAVYPSDSSVKPSGSFSLGSATVAGHSLPAADISAVASAANQVLSNLGLEILMPKVHVTQGILYVDPLQIEVVPNQNRDKVTSTVLNGVQPTYYQIANGLENGFSSDSAPYNSLGTFEASSAGQQIAAALCQSDTPITVLDITLAAFGAGGYFNTALGGVNATSANLAANPFGSLSALGLGSLTLSGSSQYISGSAGTSGTPGSSGLSSGTGTAGTPALSSGGSGATGGNSSSSQNTSGSTQSVSPAASVGYAAGGPLLAAGLAGLGLLAVLAELDRRMMRRAQHTVTFEE